MDNTSETLCSVLCKSLDVPIIGSALKPDENRTFAGYIMISVDSIDVRSLIKDEGELGKIAKIIERSKINQDRWYRLQAVISDPDYCHLNTVKILVYTCKSNRFNFTKHEYNINREDLEPFIEDIVNDKTLELWEQFQSSNDLEDILVCTHTLRDACCGQFGKTIYNHLKQVCHDTKIRIWQSSHMTGHRAAATMLILPQARYWGYLTPAISERIAKKEELKAEEINLHYRGFACLSTSEQYAERSVFIKYQYQTSENLKDILSIKKGDQYHTTVEFSKPELKPKTMTIKISKNLDVGQTKCSFLN